MELLQDDWISMSSLGGENRKQTNIKPEEIIQKLNNENYTLCPKHINFVSTLIFLRSLAHLYGCLSFRPSVQISLEGVELTRCYIESRVATASLPPLISVDIDR